MGAAWARAGPDHPHRHDAWPLTGFGIPAHTNGGRSSVAAMRSLTRSQWISIAVPVVALLGLIFIAWPLVSSLIDRLPETVSRRRILGGALFAAVFVAGLVWVSRTFRWLGWLIGAAWAAAITMVAGLVFVVWLILGSPGLEEVPRLSPQNLDAIATRAFAIVAGLGGVAFLVIAYRRQRTTENGEQREVTKLFTESFDSASDKLGSEHAAVRLAGVHALARLADEAPEGRDDLVQMVIDVLCAYLRMPYIPAPLYKGATDEQAAKHHEHELQFASLREVRHTIIRIIGNHLRETTRWRGKNFDFTGVVFDGGDLSEACFTGGRVSFVRAQFTDGRVSFARAQFTDGTVSFAGAKFTDGMVDFNEACFTGGRVTFIRAQFTGGEVSFVGAKFVSPPVNFGTAQFTGGEVNFNMAQFDDETVEFGEAQFTDGTVDFSQAVGTCPIKLLEAICSGTPSVVALPEGWRPTPNQNGERSGSDTPADTSDQ